MDKKKQNIKFIKITTMIVDILIVCLSVYLAVFIRNIPIQAENINSIRASLPFMCLSTVVLLYVYGLYSILNKTINEIILSIGILSILNIILTMAFTFFLREFAFPRSTIFISGIIQFFIMSLFRYAVLIVSRRFHGKQTLLVIGKENEVREVTNKIILSSCHLYTVKYFIEINGDLYNFNKIKELMKKVDHVVICSNVSEKDRALIFAYSIDLNINIFLNPSMFDISIKNSTLHQFDDIPTFKIRALSLTDEQKVIKRCFDLIVSIVAIILFMPALILISILVKITSPGPVIFKQERVTEKNKVYNIYKFRTMIDNAEEHTGPVLTADNDPRLTRFGIFLRSFRLDELPQLFNVLIGDMSIVGPRPERMFFIEQFKTGLPEFEYRFSVKSGITGLAQVMGKYTTNMSDKLVYDIIYIRSYSIILDMQILLQTIKIIMTKAKSQGLDNNISLDKTLSSMNCKILSKKHYYEIVEIGAVTK